MQYHAIQKTSNIWSLGRLLIHPKGAFWAKTGPIQGQTVFEFEFEFDQTVAVGTKSGNPGPSEDLRGPQI